MHLIEAATTLSMGHRLPSYDGICSSPHGHNVTFIAQVWAEGFLDFKKLSQSLNLIVSDFDHAMLLQEADPLVAALEPFGFRLVTFNVEPTTEALAAYVYNELHFSGYRIFSVRVQETARYSAIQASAPTINPQRIR